jgi:hypothetical protein
MTDNLPEPLVPAEVDLKAYPFTPMFRARLFGSSFHAKANDAEWRAGVTLWLKSWDQVPAGTLPDDDIEQCRLAELGRDHKTWAKVKARALHGWFKCSDGRLHHAVVAEGVLDAWHGHKKASAKGKAGAEKRWGKRSATATENDDTGNATAIVPDATAIARAMPSDSNRDGKGEEQVHGEGEETVPTDPVQREELKTGFSSVSVGSVRKANGFGPGTVTIEDERERLYRFRMSLAPSLGPHALSILRAASDPDHADHDASVRVCKMAAANFKPKPKGWPTTWDQYDFDGEPNLPIHSDRRPKAVAA